MGKLNNKVAIVTGAGGGFGEGIAELYVKEGAKVIVADIRGDAAKAVADKLGSSASAFTCDVSNADSVNALVAYTVQTFGIPDIVVNNAGVTHLNKPMLEINFPHGACRCAANAQKRWRCHFERRFGGGYPSSSRLDLVQRLQGRGEHHFKVDGR
jgi:NAD(P)-dependent dehydrogenase (short-subunit alcohol dehydrogenase family)